MKKTTDKLKRRLPTLPNGRSPRRPKKCADGEPLRLAMGFWERNDMTEGSKNRLAAAESLAGKSAIHTAGNLRDFGANETQAKFDVAHDLGIGQVQPDAAVRPDVVPQPVAPQTPVVSTQPAVAPQNPAPLKPKTNLPPMASGVGYPQTAFERNVLSTAVQPLREMQQIRNWREARLRGYADGRKPLTVVDGVHQPGAVIGPGTGTSDEVGPARLPGSGEKALLSNGETVVPAEATQKINEYVFNDPQGLEKATLANIDDPVNPQAFKKRIQAVGGVNAIAPFKLGEPEETAMNRVKAPLRAASKLPKGFKDKPLKLQEGGSVGTAYDELDTRTKKLDAAINAAEGGLPASEGDTGQVLDTSTRVADATAAVDPKTVVTDTRLQQKQMSPEMEAFYQKQAADQAAQAAAYKAAEDARRLEESKAKDSGGFFGFADGKASPLRAMEGRLKQTKKPARYANGIPGVTAATMPPDWVPPGNVLDKVKNFAKFQPATGGAVARLVKSRLPAAAIAATGASIASDIASTDTADYADRLNRATDGAIDVQPGAGFWSDVGIRGAGAVADLLGLGGAPEKPVQQVAEEPAPQAGTFSVQGGNRFSAVGDPNDTTASDAVTDNISARLRQDAVAQQRLADSKMALGSNDAQEAQKLADNKLRSYATMNPTGYGLGSGLGEIGTDGRGSSGGGSAKLFNTILDAQKLRHEVNQDATAREVDDSKRLEEMLSGVSDESERNNLRALRASSDPSLFYGVPAEQQFERLRQLQQIKNQIAFPKNASGGMDRNLLEAILQANGSRRDDSLENPVTQYFQQNVPLTDVVGSRLWGNPAVAPVLDPQTGKRRASLSGRLSPETQALIQAMVANKQ